MKILTEAVLQLRTMATTLAKRVGGCAEFTEGMVPGKSMELPYAFITPAAEYGEPIDTVVGTQIRHSILGVIVCIDNTDHGKLGEGNKAVAAVDSVQPLQDEIEQAFLRWKPAEFFLSKPPEYQRKSLLAGDNTRAWWQLEFDITYKVFDPLYVWPPVPGEAILPVGYGALAIENIYAHYHLDYDMTHGTADDGYFPVPFAGDPAAPATVAAEQAASTLLRWPNGLTEPHTLTDSKNPNELELGFPGHGEATDTNPEP